MQKINPTPIIAIDGTTTSGKGTIARKLAEKFGFHYLNSGALYRLTAFYLQRQNFDFERYNTLRKQEHFDTEEYKQMQQQVVDAGEKLSPIFDGKKVIVNGADIWPIISTQEYGNYAARISPTLPLREVLHKFQRNCIKLPGLVAEGRDMTSIVFTDSICKIYMDGSVEERAKRRLQDELKEESGKHKTLEDVIKEIEDRDHKDKNRNHGALKLVEDAYYLDTTDKNIDEVLALAYSFAQEKINNRN